MGTQTHVKFSRVSMPIADALAALEEEAFEPLQLKLEDFSRIQPSDDPDIPGYDAVGKLLRVRNVKEVLEEVGRGESFGLGYLVGVPAYIYLNFFEFDDQAYSLLLTFESSLLFYTDEDNKPGDVLERILSRIVATLDIDVCGYNASNRYFGAFDSLSVEEIVDGVRSGELLQMPAPFYYAIKAGHVSTKELRLLAAGTEAKYKRYGEHHVLSAWLR